MNPFSIVQQFEQELCLYTGARFACTVTSCTSALMLACAYWKAQNWDVDTISLPMRTYVGVPMAVKLAGFNIEWRDDNWESVGQYELSPFPIIDSARLLTSGMHQPNKFECVSFHPAKHLGLTTGGGAILHDDPEADRVLRKMRLDGRSEGKTPQEDTFDVLGYHCYLEPAQAAEGIRRLGLLPKHNEPLKWDGYRDLSTIALFAS